MFSTHLDNFLPFSSNLKLSSANFFILEESKMCRLVMDLTTLSRKGFKNLLKKVTSIFSFVHNIFYIVKELEIIYDLQKLLILTSLKFSNLLKG